MEALVKFGIFAGLRPGESCGFQWDNVDLKKAELRVRHSFSERDGLAAKTKAGNQKYRLSILGCVLDRIHHKQERPKRGYVLANRNGNSIYNNYWDDYFKPTMTRAGLVDEDGVNLFDLHC